MSKGTLANRQANHVCVSLGQNDDITCRLADRMPERERKNLDVRLGLLSCRVEGQELVFRELRLIRKEDRT